MWAKEAFKLIFASPETSMLFEAEVVDGAGPELSGAPGASAPNGEGSEGVRATGDRSAYMSEVLWLFFFSRRVHYS